MSGFERVGAVPPLLDELAMAWERHADDLTDIWRGAVASADAARAQPEFAPLLIDRTDHFLALIGGANLERRRITGIATEFRAADGGALGPLTGTRFALTDDEPPPATGSDGGVPPSPTGASSGEPSTSTTDASTAETSTLGAAATTPPSPSGATRRRRRRASTRRTTPSRTASRMRQPARARSTRSRRTTGRTAERRQAMPIGGSRSKVTAPGPQRTTPPLPLARLLDPRQQLVAVAASQLGYRERSGNRTAYGAWFGLDGSPWCAMFVSWCLAAAGTPLPAIDGPRGAASVADLRRWAGRTGRTVTGAAPGDLLLIDHGNGKGHVAIVERVDTDGTIHTIEGNTDPRGGANGVMVARRVRRVTGRTVIVRP